jgi:type I restriction enzyme S subunit
MPHHALLTKGLKGHKVSAQSKGPGSATDGFTSFSGVVSSELPDGWQLRRLGELVERPQYGLTASATGEPKGPRFLRITDIQESGLAWRTVPYCECNADSAERLRLRPGDVVVARIGATTGKAYLIRDEVDAVFASYLIRLRATDRLVPDFFAFFTNSAPYWRQIDSVKGGRLKQGINIPLLESLEIPLPPLAEQRAIAEVLRTVQRAKEATEKVIAATRQLKTSLMKHFFTYDPVPLDQAAYIPLKETAIGTMPAAWSVARVGEIGEVVTGTTPSTKRPEFYGGPHMFITPGDMGARKYIAQTEKWLTDVGLAECRALPKNAVVVVCIGATIGKTGLTGADNCATNQQCNSVIASEQVDPEFLFYGLSNRAPALPPLASRAAVPIVNKSNFCEFQVALPPLSEQREIAAQLSAVDGKLAAEERRREALDALFKSLLNHLMTGKVRLPEFCENERYPV